MKAQDEHSEVDLSLRGQIMQRLFQIAHDELLTMPVSEFVARMERGAIPAAALHQVINQYCHEAARLAYPEYVVRLVDKAHKELKPKARRAPKFTELVQHVDPNLETR